MLGKQYNLYNFEALFKQYLVTENISPISSKNYLSDIRHFFGWLTFKLKTQIKDQLIDEKNIIGLINYEIVLEYKSYLSDNNLPLKTVNRRLSTVRKFCSFCISQRWMKENPAKKIQNLTLPAGRQEFRVQNQIDQDNEDVTEEKLITKFKEELLKNQDIKQVNILINDVKEFLSSSDINISLSQPVIS